MIRTLVVDDDPVIAGAHLEFVNAVEGFTAVGVARAGVEALREVRRHTPDLVLLDFGLPDMNGLDVCRSLRAGAQPPVDVIAVTAARDVTTIQQAISYGVMQYLIKPFVLSSLREKLQRYARYRSRLSTSEGLAAQHDVDLLFAALRGAMNEPLPKGLGRDTWAAVVGVLRDSAQPVSAAQVAQHAGLSRVTARRYLEHLIAQDLATRTLRYGGAGRPEQLYRWAAHAVPGADV